MEPAGSLPCSQKTATGTYPEKSNLLRNVLKFSPNQLKFRKTSSSKTIPKTLWAAIVIQMANRCQGYV